MGSGSDVSKEASDVILTSNDFSTLVTAIQEGKGIHSNIQNFLGFQLSTSIAALSIIAISTFLHFDAPLNAMQILWISKFSFHILDILCDGPVAQSLGVEPVDPSVLSTPPRPPSTPILTRALLKRILLSSSLITASTLLVFMSENGSEKKRCTTMTFTTFVILDLLVSATYRSPTRSVFVLDRNTFYSYAVVFCAIGQALVVYLPLLQGVFQTQGLSGWDLVKVLVCGFVLVFGVDEVWKRKRGKDVERDEVFNLL